MKDDQMDVHYNDELISWIQEFGAETLYLNDGINSDSGSNTLLPEAKYWEFLGDKVDRTNLFHILQNSRAIKSD